MTRPQTLLQKQYEETLQENCNLIDESKILVKTIDQYAKRHIDDIDEIKRLKSELEATKKHLGIALNPAARSLNNIGGFLDPKNPMIAEVEKTQHVELKIL